MQHQGDGGEGERAEEAHHEPGVDDRLVDLLERTDEGPVVGLAQAGHDRVRVEAEDTRHQPHRQRGQDQCRGSQGSHRTLSAPRFGGDSVRFCAVPDLCAAGREQGQERAGGEDDRADRQRRAHAVGERLSVTRSRRWPRRPPRALRRRSRRRPRGSRWSRRTPDRSRSGGPTRARPREGSAKTSAIPSPAMANGTISSP